MRIDEIHERDDPTRRHRASLVVHHQRSRASWVGGDHEVGVGYLVGEVLSRSAHAVTIAGV